jgi:16S rRNA (uracil1498-N3)-methyltransferase
MTADRPCSVEGESGPPGHAAPRCHAARLGAAGSILDLDGDEATHLSRVLRLNPGDAVEVFDGTGGSAAARIESCSRHGVRIRIDQVRSSPPPGFEGILVQALPKGEKKDLIVQKAVELGLARLVFVESERSVARLGGEGASRREQRWQRVAIGAAKQCRRDWLPRIEAAPDVPAAVASVPAGVRVLCEALPGARPLRDVLREASVAGAASVTLFVGPEGGYSPAEIRLILDAGACAASLGPTILRTETAALFAMSALAYEFSR